MAQKERKVVLFHTATFEKGLLEQQNYIRSVRQSARLLAAIFRRLITSD